MERSGLHRGAFTLIGILSISSGAVSAQEASNTAATAPATQVLATRPQLVDPAAPPRQVIEQAMPRAVELLRDRSMPREQRVGGLRQMMLDYTDFPTLSRLILGDTWDKLSESQRKDFIAEFTEHLIGVYLPLTEGFARQDVGVADDHPEPRGDHTVLIKVTDHKAGQLRTVASIACRMRQAQERWQVIDLTIEGISVARVFSAQFRPVVAIEGFDGLLNRLRQKNAQNKPQGDH